jgi:thymidylate kinase
VKNHLFPIETAMLGDLNDANGMPVPNPAAELTIFTLRILTKFKPYHVLKPSVADRLRREARKEFAFLESHENGERASLLASRFFPGIGSDLFRSALQSLEDDASIFEILASRRRILRLLRTYRRRGTLATIRALLERRVFLFAWPRRFGRIPKRTPASGGLLVAIVGPDGSGKSTAVETLDRWLKPFLNVTRGHMGKPPKSVQSVFVDRLVSLAERWAGTDAPPARTPPHHEIGGGAALQTLYAWQLTCLARDRKRESERLARAVEHGQIVLCDRYPLPDLQSMEGRHGHRLEKAAGFLARRWVRAEQTVHESIERPGLVIGLRIPPDLASRRQPGDGAEFVAFRAREFFEYAGAPGRDIVAIDAAAPLDEVSARLRQIVWQTL